MARKAGKEGVVVIGGTTKLAVTRFEENDEQNLIDVSGFDSTNFKEYIPESLRNVSFSVSAFMDTDSGGDEEPADASLVTFSLTPYTGGTAITGSGYIRRCRRSNQMGQARSYDFDLQPTGTVTGI